MQYTTSFEFWPKDYTLFYHDFKDTFVCNTQPAKVMAFFLLCCFIKISKILLYAIHNLCYGCRSWFYVVLSRFQRYFCMQYTTVDDDFEVPSELFYQDFKDTFVCNTQLYSTAKILTNVVLSGFQ